MVNSPKVSLVVSLAVLVVAARLITVALLVIIVLLVNFLIGQCISICCNRPCVLVFPKENWDTNPLVMVPYLT